jgi:ABC-type lipoprotein export system ATPase subunit
MNASITNSSLMNSSPMNASGKSTSTSSNVGNPNEPLVAVRAVGRTFGPGLSSVVAVHDANCSIHAGDHIALMGASGSGKTTLLHLLAGLDIPTVGIITWPAIGARRALRPGSVAVVFQAPSLLPALDVSENVALPLLLRGVNSEIARSSARDALRSLGLELIANKLPEELSGGQAQRVAVARVLADHPRLILADEPTGQLDRTTGLEVIDALLTAAKLTGAALVVNTHDPLIADQFPLRWSMTAGQLTITEPISC